MTKINPMPKRLEECHRQGRRCDVPRCGRPRQKVGRFCDYHDLRCQHTGDPEGRVILMKDIRAWIKDARPYLKKHQDRPDIAKALGWIERLVYQGGSAPLPDVHDNSAPDTRLLRWLVFLRKREVSPIDALALVVAMFAYRAFSPREFRSDRQFVHSLVIRFIRQAGSTKRPGNRGRRQKHYERITVGVRELLGPSLITNLGAVSHAIAKELVGRFDEANPARHLQALL